MSFKTGQVIQNEQGRFAKIVEIKGSRFGLSAWVTKKEAAEAETVVVRYLNSFGMSQVLPEDASKAEKGKKDEGKVSLVEQMTVPQLRAYCVLLGIESDGTKPKLTERINAYLQAEVDEMEDHVVSQEDLDGNPGLAEMGVAVGDTVKFPKNPDAE